MLTVFFFFSHQMLSDRQESGWVIDGTAMPDFKVGMNHLTFSRIHSMFSPVHCRDFSKKKNNIFINSRKARCFLLKTGYVKMFSLHAIRKGGRMMTFYGVLFGRRTRCGSKVMFLVGEG